MCACNPCIRTPYCGKPGCTQPVQEAQDMPLKPKINTMLCVTLDVPRDIFASVHAKLHGMGYQHMVPDMIDLSGVVMVPKEAEDWHLNPSGSVAVGNVFFYPITKDTPRKKCILLGPGNTATMGIYDGDPQWKGWFPCPDIPDEMKEDPAVMPAGHT